MTSRVLPPSWGYMISIATGVLRRNLAEKAEGKRPEDLAPMVNVKVRHNPETPGNVGDTDFTPFDAGTFRKIEILNPHDLTEVLATLCEHYDRPVPGSDGRGVCYITTRAPLRVHED